MSVYAPIILCFVPFATMFVLFAILVPKISVAKEFVASFAGLLALIPIALAQFLIPGMRLFGQSRAISIMLYSIVFLGLVEECFKALMLFMVGAKGERLGVWFCLSLLAGMIFGCFESVIYFLQDFQNIGHGVTLNLIYLRMFTAVLVHTLCSGLGGFFVFYQKNIRANIWPLFTAVVIHGLYDYFVSFNSPLKYFSVAVILFAAMKCRVYFSRAAEELSQKKSASTKILDPNKTVELPKNPAIIIPVKKTIPEDSEIVEEVAADEEAVDFDQIEREAKNELKAAKKPRPKTPAKKSDKSKGETKKAAAKTSKTAKSGKTKSGTKDKSAKAAPAKASAKKTPAKKSGESKGGAKKAAAKTKTAKGKK